MLISGIINSMANITPPIGVLNVAAMPAPAPAATRMMRWPGVIRTIWPSVDPSAEPIWMIGPSRPTAAPLPIDTADASDFTAATTGRSRRPCSKLRRSLRARHGPRASGAKFDTRKVTTTAPITGTKITQAPHGPGGVNTLAS